VNQKFFVFLLRYLFAGLFLFTVANAYAEGKTENSGPTTDYISVTAANTEIDLEDLEFMILPLTKAELEIEAVAWQKVLAKKVREISNGEIKNNLLIRETEILEEMSDAAEDVTEAATEGDTQDLSEAKQTMMETSGNLSAKSEDLKHLASVPPQELEQKISKEGEKAELIQELLAEELVLLRIEQSEIVTRFAIILDKLKQKGGDVTELKLYTDSVSGIQVDIGDTSTAWLALTAWMQSAEGGLLMLFNLVKFILALCFVWFLSNLAGRLADRLTQHSAISSLLERFIKVAARRVILFIGFIVSLTILGFNVGPVLALIGAAGLVVGLALQNTLSNFASGVLILVYRPFDVNDIIKAGGVDGIVQSMTLVSTTIKTLDNQLVVIPNNSVWNDTIINVTGSTERRVDMMFGIGYGDDFTKARNIMQKILADHPKVLEKPESNVRIHELGDSSVNFVCRPWVKTDDYWDVYWDVTEAVKREFDAQGVSIPFPQRDVHLIPSVQLAVNVNETKTEDN